MIQFIELLFISSFWIWGFNFIYKKGQIFYIESMQELPKWFLKPTINCPSCMSSLHGSAFFFFGVSELHFHILLWPIFVICLVGLNHIITAFIYDLE